MGSSSTHGGDCVPKENLSLRVEDMMVVRCKAVDNVGALANVVGGLLSLFWMTS